MGEGVRGLGLRWLQLGDTCGSFLVSHSLRFTLSCPALRTDNPVLAVLAQYVALQALPRLRPQRCEAQPATPRSVIASWFANATT